MLRDGGRRGRRKGDEAERGPRRQTETAIDLIAAFVASTDAPRSTGPPDTHRSSIGPRHLPHGRGARCRLHISDHGRFQGRVGKFSPRRETAEQFNVHEHGHRVITDAEAGAR